MLQETLWQSELLFIASSNGLLLKHLSQCHECNVLTRSRNRRPWAGVVLMAKSRSNKAKGSKRPAEGSKSKPSPAQPAASSPEAAEEKPPSSGAKAASSRSPLPFSGPIAPYLLRNLKTDETKAAEGATLSSPERAATESNTTSPDTKQESHEQVASSPERRADLSDSRASSPRNDTRAASTSKKAKKSSRTGASTLSNDSARDSIAPGTKETPKQVRASEDEDPASVMELVRAFRKERQTDDKVKVGSGPTSSSSKRDQPKSKVDLSRFRIKDIEEETREHSYDPVAAVLGKGRPSRRFFGTLLGPYLQNSHIVGLVTVLLCTFGYDPGNPLTNLSEDIRDKLRKSLLIVGTINLVMALQAWNEARRREQSTWFWFLKTMALGGLALRELEENVPLPQKEKELNAKQTK
jgi:hypothetical protein